MEQLSDTPFDLSGSDADCIPTIESVNLIINGLITDVNAMVIRMLEIQNNVDTIKDLVTRQTLESSIELFVGKISQMLESLGLVIQFNELHGQLGELLNNLCDLSGVQIEDLSGFVDTSGFDLNLLKGVFKGAVFFGDDSVDDSGPSGYNYLYDTVGGDPDLYPWSVESGYYNEGLSNGDSWGKLLAGYLEVQSYSYGMIGSTMNQGNSLLSGTIGSTFDINKQLTSFISQHIVDPEKLYVLTAGRRDLIDLISCDISGTDTSGSDTIGFDLSGVDLYEWKDNVIDFITAKANDLLTEGVKVLVLASSEPFSGTQFEAPYLLSQDSTELVNVQMLLDAELVTLSETLSLSYPDCEIIPWGVNTTLIDSLFPDKLQNGYESLLKLYCEEGINLSSLGYMFLDEGISITTIAHSYMAKNIYEQLVERRSRIKTLLANI